ncbi:gamma-glutamylcyclotransferase family protein [Marinobacter bohaiensis]|uniref:gamma-glutamylcyclotransferase family protein n=1 Tax=Marinobacter bohaiensis TaxID=2201898 RepID=UPI000DAB94BE|nr:gamma-glutamylcyclotransferase family protein [Marinobacter bohaiensis]
MFYFAYGSNLSRARLQARVPEAEPVAVASLPEHRLCFHKVSRRDGSGKCDALYTGDRGDRVLGVIYDVSDEGKRVLDRIEGLGHGYDEKLVVVELGDASRRRVWLYVASDIDAGYRPYGWYKQHVLAGAREHGFPSAYIDVIEAVETVEDLDVDRHYRETAIYQRGD